MPASPHKPAHAPASRSQLALTERSRWVSVEAQTHLKESSEGHQSQREGRGCGSVGERGPSTQGVLGSSPPEDREKPKQSEKAAGEFHGLSFLEPSC